MILDDNTAAELFRQFRQELAVTQAAGEAAPYPDFEASSTSHHPTWAYSHLMSEHMRELGNAVNAFLMYLHQLKAWDAVLSRQDQTTAWHARIDLVQPLAYFCLGAPYLIRQRICASVALLSHQANSVKVHGWTDTSKLDRPKYPDAARLAAGWGAWPRLDGELASLNSPEFTSLVDDFRNESHHGFPRGIGDGQSLTVSRKLKETGVTYSYGVKPALSLTQIVSALEPQYSAAGRCYEAYVCLVGEQWSALAQADA